MKYADEIIEQYYDLEDFVREVQDISKHFKGKVIEDYIDRLDAIWCDADNERESLEKAIEEIEQAELREQNLEFERSRI